MTNAQTVSLLCLQTDRLIVVDGLISEWVCCKIWESEAGLDQSTLSICYDHWRTERFQWQTSAQNTILLSKWGQSLKC